MKDFWGLFENDAYDDKDAKKEASDDETLRLRQEELDITKNKVTSGEVTLSKEIIEDQKTVNVPVSHEEVVIERRAIDNEPSDSPITSGETIRIPVSEEKVEVGKHTVVTGEVSAHKREVEETEQVTETLKREEAHVDTSGDTDVVDDKTDHGFH